MIAAVACVPQTPLLLPGLGGRPVPEIDRLRDAAAGAVTFLLEQEVDEVIVVGAARSTGPHPADAPDPTARLAPAPGRRSVPGELPVPLAVARSLLAGCDMPWSLYGAAQDAGPEVHRDLGAPLGRRPGRGGLLVAADGSACRTEKAPGYFDPRALGLDQRIVTALRHGDVSGLAALDPEACRDLLVSGRAAWHVMAGACEGGRWLARMLYEDDPFGVAYWVATWLRCDGEPRAPL
ncbi:hypothetical protein [Nonomuraea sp. NPDC003709]|uniref:hypothetical protein n=1 Tax=Nonomuraea sp. NPDC003709 TaxID=3154450 RepID=UPI0033BDF534